MSYNNDRSGRGQQEKTGSAGRRMGGNWLGLFDAPISGEVAEVGGFPRLGGGFPAAEGGGRLEQVSLNGTGGEGESEAGGRGAGEVVERLIVMGCKCRRWACPECGMAYWGRFRARTLGSGMGKIFKRAGLFTLTLDRAHFVEMAKAAGKSEGEAAEFAWEHVERRGYIRLLMRLLGVKKWVKVLAFHPQNKEWVHWHIVLDLGDLWGGRVDLKKAWALWHGKWRCGGLDLQAHKRYGGGEYSAERALGYAIGYCQHQGGVVADWVLNRSGRRLPRAYELGGECREWDRERRRVGVVAVADQGEGCCEDSGGDAVADCVRSAAARSSRTVGEAIRECGKGVQFVRELCYPDGSKFYKWVGSCADVSLSDLLWAARAQRVDGGRVERVVRGDSERLRLVVDGKSADGVNSVLRAANFIRGGGLRVVFCELWWRDCNPGALLDWYDLILERDTEAVGESFTGEAVELVSDEYAPF